MTSNENKEVRLQLGTAQLGSPYGSVKKTDPPNIDEAKQLVKQAMLHCLEIDTASAYEHSETIIGDAAELVPPELRTQITTKLGPSLSITPKSSPEEIVEIVRREINTSISKLGSNFKPNVLLHNPEHMHAYNSGILHALISLQQEGIIRKIGVSVSNPNQFIEAVNNITIQIIQFPYNIIDWRWRSTKIRNAVLARQDLSLVARSAYLQGILLKDLSYWPEIGLPYFEAIDKTLNDLVKKFGRESKQDLALAWLRCTEESPLQLEQIVIGSENIDQLGNNLKLWKNPPLTKEQILICESVFPRVPEKFLDPSQWSLA